MGRKAVDSNAIFIDGLFIPEADRIGEEGKGFSYILHSLNPERILIAVEAIGIGQDAQGDAGVVGHGAHDAGQDHRGRQRARQRPRPL